MSFFRRRQPSVQVQDNQAALVRQQQQQQQEQMRQQQLQQKRERDQELEQQRALREAEREKQAQRMNGSPSAGGGPLQQQSPPQGGIPSSASQQRLDPGPPSQDQPQSQQQLTAPSRSTGADNANPAPTKSRPAYPWSARRLAIQPVATLVRSAGAPTASPSPFPRYGHSLPPIATASGELFLFGGLVREQVKNDLYSFSTRDLSAALIETKGEIPPPRVGHASALVSSVLIVWGGDTKTTDADKQDDALYLLNLGTREWTRVATVGPSPVGRYGHAVTMCGTRFFIFGGQVDGEFMNDLWAFDLSSLKTPDPNWELYSPAPGSDLPAKRTGHVCVTHNDKIYLFGGTDGQYHYNDTWAFDVPTRTWRELSCIGFIPVPREGHAAALVDDVMYVFGGRGVDGKDLGDLAAFKISNSRWYMFQNMGPSPSGRSGHAMAASGSRVFVLGGESFTTLKPDDPTMIHVLDARHIKYPDSNRGPNPPASGAPSGRTPSFKQPSITPAGAASSGSPPSANTAPATATKQPPQQNDARDRAMSPSSTAVPVGTARDRAMSPPASRTGAMSPQERVAQQQPQGRSSPAAGQRAISPTQPAKSGPNGVVPFPLGSVGTPPTVNGQLPAVKPKPPPIRPKRDDEALLALQSADKERSEEGGSSMEGGPTTPASIAAAPSKGRATPPAINGISSAASNPSRAISPPNGIRGRESPALATPPIRPNGLSARSPSPIVSSQPPADAFYYPSSSSAPGRSPGINGHQNRGSAGNIGADVMRAKDAELESMRRRETWMKAALAKAAKSGFVWADGDLQGSRVGTWLHDDDDEQRDGDDSDNEGVNGGGKSREGLAHAMMKLKQEHAKVQINLAGQARAISDRLAEADRIRSGAVQEAAFYRAKLAAYESGNVGEIGRLERDRANYLEFQLQTLVADRATAERKAEDLAEASALHARLREQAEERAAEAIKRAEIAEEAHEGIRRDHSSLQEQHLLTENSLRDHADRLVALTSTSRQIESEHESLRMQFEEVLSSREQHERALDQAQTALKAAGARAIEMDEQWQSARKQVTELEAELLDLRNDMEARIQEAETATARLADAENAWAKSREEADAYRSMTTGGLGELLDTQREMQADDDRATRGHAEKIRAMEQEASSLRKMLKEAGTRVDAAQSTLAEQRDRTRTLEGNLMTLRAQTVGLRSQLAVALSDGGRLRKELSARESELREKSKLASETEIRLGMLRNYLADSGLVVDEEEMSSSQGSTSSGSRLQQLQSQLQQSKQNIEDVELRLQDAARSRADAESQMRLMASELDRLRSGSARSPSSSDDHTTRAMAAERKLAESEAFHKEKMQQMEHDYQTAVHYVKGTEKMLRRMKDELTKQKTLNTTLQSELDSSRGVNGSEAGARTRNANGRNTPLSDDDGLRNQLMESQRQSTRLTMENRDLHRRLDTLQADVEDLRDNLASTQRESEARLHHAEDLQAEVDRLDHAIRMTRGGGDAVQMSSENSALKAENKMLTDKINLLLEVDQPGYADQRASTISARRASHSSSENAIAFESLSNELDDWQRRLASSSGSSRPMSDYDEPPRQTPTERLR